MVRLVIIEKLLYRAGDFYPTIQMLKYKLLMLKKIGSALLQSSEKHQLKKNGIEFKLIT